LGVPDLQRALTALAAGLGLAVTAAGQTAPAASAKPAEAVSLSKAQIAFVVSNTVFALLHEMGHVIIRDFDVPLLGMEEDSADTLAALIMLSGGSPKASAEYTDKLTRALALAAVGNAMIWKSGLEQNNTEILFWDQHGLSARRASRIACLIYGSNPKRYAWVADSAKMPDRRRDNCEDEFELARHAGAWVADTYGDRGGHIKEGPAPQVSVVYEPAKGDMQVSIRHALEQRRIVEAIVAKVDVQFAFKKALVVKVSRCGQPNAYWDSEYRELQLCYELLESFVQQSSDPDVARAYATITDNGHPPDLN
jgi:putative metallopeptidase DUF4344